MKNILFYKIHIDYNCNEYKRNWFINVVNNLQKRIHNFNIHIFVCKP